MPKFEKQIQFDYQELESLTNEFSDTAIAKLKGCAMSTVYLARKEFGIMSFKEKTGNRISRKSGRVLVAGTGEYFDKNKLDRTFFQEIDTELKAYTLGLLATDGFISYKPDGKYFGIELQQPDSIVLHQIEKAISDNPTLIKQCTRKGKKPSERILIHSRDLVEQLLKLGITLKTGDRQCLRSLPSSIARHYLRGIFDGDGCLSSTKNHLILSVSSHDLAYGVVELASLYLGLTRKVSVSIRNEKPFYTVGFWGKDKAKPMIDFLYSDSTIAIPRKLKEASIWLSRF